MAVNIIAKSVKGKEYLISEMIATRLTDKQWQKIKELNPQLFGDSDSFVWRFIPQKETDFSWWPKISRKLTSTKIKGACFDCDYYGNITEY
jgi:hypothetical protein